MATPTNRSPWQVKLWGLLTQPKSIDDECKGDDADEHHIELVIVGEYPAKALEAAKQSLDLVAPLVELLVVLPRLKALLAQWYDRDEAHL